MAAHGAALSLAVESPGGSSCAAQRPDFLWKDRAIAPRVAICRYSPAAPVAGAIASSFDSPGHVPRALKVGLREYHRWQGGRTTWYRMFELRSRLPAKALRKQSGHTRVTCGSRGAQKMPASLDCVVRTWNLSTALKAGMTTTGMPAAMRFCASLRCRCGLRRPSPAISWRVMGAMSFVWCWWTRRSRAP